MRKRPPYSSIPALSAGALFLLLSCAPPPVEEGAGPPALEGDYMGQPPPGARPELFLPGIVSTGMDELNSVFSPDGDEFVFAVKTPDRSRHTLLSMERTDGRWSSPRVLPFSGRYSDADPAFSPDGNQLFFISRRPDDEAGEPLDDWDIWVVARTRNGWGAPQRLAAPVNTDQLEVYPSIAANGTLYFSSGRPGGLGKNDIYRATLIDGTYAEPENLGPAINTEHSEGDLYVAPDESFIVFVSSGREDGHGSADLYVSFRNPDRSWTTAVNLGDTVNTRWTEYCPVVTGDGRFLFFTSYRVAREEPSTMPLTYDQIKALYAEPRSGFGDIYWMDAGILQRPKAE